MRSRDHTVHHLNNSRSQRVLWLLEELELPYEIRCYERDAKTMLAPPSLREVHPLGKSPVVSDGGLTLAESGAIIEYLVERHGGGQFAPAPGTPARLRYTYWLHYAEGSAMPLLLKLVFDRIESGPMPFFVKPIARVIVIWTTWNRSLRSSAGSRAMKRAGLGASRPRLMDFLARIHARPAYQRALERGGKYDLLG